MIRKFALSLAAALCATTAHAGTPIGDVFVIAMENQNSVVYGTSARPDLTPIYNNPAAPFINSLVTPGNPNAQYTSFASAYHNIINGASDLHPSEPNYVYQISGLPGVITDNDPNTVGNYYTAPNLGQSLTAAGLTWKSYQEGIDTTGGTSTVTNTLAPQSAWTVPATSFSGTNSAYVNPYNGSNQFNVAPKHDPFPFFSSNQNAANYAPLQQLTSDLQNNTVGNFNWITPDQYNDMHSALKNGFTYNGTYYPNAATVTGGCTTCNDQEEIAQGDNFLSIVVPQIEASQAFKNNGLIVIWTDENEGDTPTTNSNYTNMEILIGHDAKGNAFTDFVPMNHSTDLKTYLDIFGLSQAGYPSNITGSNTLGSLLKPNSILPEPGTWAMMILGFGVMGMAMRRRPVALAA